MATIDAPTVLGFAAGIAGTVAAFGAKYAFDFRLAKRRLELEERGALATSLAGRPGQLRRSAVRMNDRVDAVFRDAPSMGSWLAQGPTAAQDGYFLRTSVQRVFLFLSWGALMQQALDSLPAETLRARRDLQYQYALLDVSVRVLTGIAMFPAFPAYPTDRAGYHMFTGTVDEVVDIGVAMHNRNSQVISSSEFIDAYAQSEPSLMSVREFVSSMRSNDAQSAVVRARFACLAAVLQEILAPSITRSFSNNTVLSSRLAGLMPAARGYDLVAILPPWLDAELAGACARWQRD